MGGGGEGGRERDTIRTAFLPKMLRERERVSLQGTGAAGNTARAGRLESG